MPLSYTRLTADGTTDVFTFALPYVSDKDLTVFVNGTLVPFEPLAQGTVRLTQKPQPGDVIEIHRTTSVSALAQEYTGAGISKEALKANAIQVLHKLQELEEGSVTLGPLTADLKGKRLTNLAEAYEEALLSRKQEFLEILEEEKERLDVQERSAREALETLETTAKAVNASAQENKDLLVAERVKAVAEISELMGRHKVLLETCDSKEKSLQDRITKDTSSLESKVTDAVSLLESKLKETFDALDQKMTEALTTCQSTTADLGGTLKTQLTEKVQETLESMTKVRLVTTSEGSELLGRVKAMVESLSQERDTLKELALQIKTLEEKMSHLAVSLMDGEVTQTQKKE